MNTTTLELRGGPQTVSVNGKQRGCNVVGRAVVLDDEFTRYTLMKISWHLTPQGYPATSVNAAGGERRIAWLHEFVYENYYYGPHPPGREVDHIDRNPLNNVPKNLRLVTRSVNAANSGKQSNNTSGYKGVSWSKQNQKWRACIAKDSTFIHLGYFDDILDAAAAVNAAYREHYPEVAIPNPEAD